jgi:hypothetical protein
MLDWVDPSPTYEAYASAKHCLNPAKCQNSTGGPKSIIQITNRSGLGGASAQPAVRRSRQYAGALLVCLRLIQA